MKRYGLTLDYKSVTRLRQLFLHASVQVGVRPVRVLQSN